MSKIESAPHCEYTDRAAGLPLVERLDSRLEAANAFRRLSHLPHVVFLDSAMRHPTLGRYSFVTADPVEWLEVPADGSDGLAMLAGHPLWRQPRAARADLPPFQGGFAGMFGYELARGIERVPAAGRDEFQLPALAVGLYDVVLAFDHVEGGVWLISQGYPESDPAARRERAAARLAEFRGYLAADSTDWERAGLPGGAKADAAPAHTILAPEELAEQHVVASVDGLTSNFSAAGYWQAVRRVIDYIHAGDVFQVNLSQRLLHRAISPAVELYGRLRERNPAPFAGYLDGGCWQIASASPERFLRVLGGRVETRPIKGTRRRSPQPEDDSELSDELRDSAKDRAENVMIVDLLRNDLSRTCRPESVRVSQLCEVETYAWVQHLVSVVEGELAEGATALDLLRTCFPGGSITGAPKLRAMEIIAELEPTARGAYCGALGYIGLDGGMDSSILIRTITAARGWWQLPVGGGIVADSNPEAEYEETWHKAAGLLQSLWP